MSLRKWLSDGLVIPFKRKWKPFFNKLFKCSWHSWLISSKSTLKSPRNGCFLVFFFNCKYIVSRWTKSVKGRSWASVERWQFQSLSCIKFNTCANNFYLPESTILLASEMFSSIYKTTPSALLMKRLMYCIM